ncbi:DUF4870 domain-containing protein [Paenibacillus sp. YAF4_2]|uniref:DUF4870 domain-containing protein n=1 Tax=Paenibacillus sp. YAF4_2 TaxID=3233085 RepID=UPI003F9536E2
MSSASFEPDRSSTGIDPKVAALLAYFLGFITGIIFLVVEKQSRFVKFHALQSIAVSVVFIVLNLILGFIPIIGWLLGLIVTPVGFILWIALMLLALQGKRFKLPYIGDWAEQQSSRF